MLIDTTELGQVPLQHEAYHTTKIMSYKLVVLYSNTCIACKNISLSSWIVSVLLPGILSLPVGQRTDSGSTNVITLVHSHYQAVNTLHLQSLKHHLPKGNY